MTHTQLESGNLNGSATLYLMVGRIEADVKHLQSDVRDVSAKVDRLASRRSLPPLKDLGGFMIGLTLVIVALAQKWDLVGQLARAYGK